MPELRKNKQNKSVVYGRATEVIPGRRFEFHGEHVQIQSVGKPFDVKGVPHVYGYLTGPTGSRHIGSSLAEIFSK